MEGNERVLRTVVGAVAKCNGQGCDGCWAQAQPHGTSPTLCCLVETLNAAIEAVPDSLTHVNIGGKSVKVR